MCRWSLPSDSPAAPMPPDDNISAEDPYFVDPDNSDWRLRDYRVVRCSPCIDHGYAATLPLDTRDANGNLDFDEYLPDRALMNRVRPGAGFPASAAPDIGAYERGCPETCRPDLNGDGQIGSADLAILLGACGECEVLHSNAGSDCHCADVNFDYMVDAADMGIVLGAWGPCADPCGNNAMAMQSAGHGDSESGDAPSAPETWAALWGFDSVDSFAQWLGTLTPEARAAVLAPILGGEQ